MRKQVVQTRQYKNECTDGASPFFDMGQFMKNLTHFVNAVYDNECEQDNRNRRSQSIQSRNDESGLVLDGQGNGISKKQSSGNRAKRKRKYKTQGEHAP